MATIDTTIDGHVHCRLCHHAVGEMEEYVRTAIARGLRKMVFLEHLELGIRYFEPTWLTAEDFAWYFEEGSRLQDVYRNQLEIGLGVEVGYNPRRVGDIRDFLNRYEWDRIGISYHFLEVDGRHYNMVSRKQENLAALGTLGIDEVVSRYFQGLLEAIEQLPGTVLCHLDAVLRHFPAISFSARHRQQMVEVLAAAARRGMALEVNTSGFALRDEPFPMLFLLYEAMERGLPFAAGSDAHRPEDVGRHFDRLATLLPRRPGGRIIPPWC